MPTIKLASRALGAMALVSLAFAAAAPAATHRQAAKVVRSAGSTVKAMQRALGVPADGVYGPQTRKAVRRFQRAHGLTVDGIAGAADPRRPRAARPQRRQGGPGHRAGPDRPVRVGRRPDRRLA